jgi:hypothetical protein
VIGKLQRSQKRRKPSAGRSQLDVRCIGAALSDTTINSTEILVEVFKAPGEILVALRTSRPIACSARSIATVSSRDDPIKAILVMTIDKWDHDGTPEAVRNNFRKALDCHTPAMGGTLYASDSEQYIGHDTCKSRQCTRCGSRGTLD